DDPQNRADLRRAQAAVALVRGDLDRSFTLSMEAAAFSWVNGPAPIAWAGRAATWAGDPGRLREALGRHVASGQRGPALELERASMRAALAGMEGRPQEAAGLYRDALTGWRDIGCVFDQALTAIEAAQVAADDPEVRAAAGDSRAAFMLLRARPFVDRLDAVLAAAGGGGGAARAAGAGPPPPPGGLAPPTRA